jgi:hypothetical protein
MQKSLLSIILLSALFLIACGDDDDMVVVEAPATYSFERNGTSTVSFSGQTTRILMGEALINGMKDFGESKERLLEMYTNETVDGSDADPFDNEDLNASTKSIRSKVAASSDYFSANTVAAAEIKADFAQWIEAQVDEVFPNQNELAEAGKAGQIADGTSTRYVNALGLEYDQAVNKGLIGALMLDQTLNNYLSTVVLDAGQNQEENIAGTTADGENYTTMEHKWDEAYGYLYGTAADPANPNSTIGSDDSFLNKYIGRMETDPDFAGISDEIYEAFKKGRAAIVAGVYDVRDEQADIIREKLSEVIAVRVVYYLQQAKIEFANGNTGGALHDLSEGYGFIYSLQFTRKPGAEAPYFTKTEVDTFLTDLMDDGPNGLWDVTDATLDSISEAVVARFDFTLDQAAE